MVDRLLVPMDRSEMAERALRFACEEFPESEITVLHVVGGPTAYMGEATGIALADDPRQAAAELAEPVFERAHEIAAEFDKPVDTAVRLGMASRAIVNHAADFDLVILGSHGRDVSARLLIGNVAETVTRRAPVSVVVVR